MNVRAHGFWPTDEIRLEARKNDTPNWIYIIYNQIIIILLKEFNFEICAIFADTLDYVFCNQFFIQFCLFFIRLLLFGAFHYLH